MSRARAVGLLGLAAVALMLPVMLGPLRLNDSHWINFGWSQQFTALVRQGALWPRWLPQSHDGLGAPVFYFYGPVAFWLAALASCAGLGTWASLVAAATLALWASGAAMRLLLAGSRRPLGGALLYMALPYHMLDFTMRGALAEFTAFAALPIVALGMRRAAGGRIGLLAGGYALLICTHLPTALLFSVFLLPLLLWEQRAAFGRCVTGLALGLAIAAPYLAPALLLQSAVSLRTMTGASALRTDAWTIFSADPAIRHGLGFLGIVAATSVLIALPHLRQRWAWAVLVGAALAMGLVPLVWRLPPLDRAQFPWRILSLVEFAAAILVARSRLPPERLLLLASPALILSLTIVATPPPPPSIATPTRAEIERRHPDVIEYLPPGAGETRGAWSRRALALAAHTPMVRQEGGWTIVRRHAFPAWRVRCAGHEAASGAEPGTGLLRYRGARCTVDRKMTAPERFGFILAVSAIAALAARALIRRACRAWPEARPSAASAPTDRRWPRAWASAWAARAFPASRRPARRRHPSS